VIKPDALLSLLLPAAYRQVGAILRVLASRHFIVENYGFAFRDISPNPACEHGSTKLSGSLGWSCLPCGLSRV
jgi:hypothetical protein